MKIKRLNNRGDTIVEVLICIAILSLIVAAAYSLTSKNQQTAQQSQERGEALMLANKQLELLRTYADGQPLDPLKSSKFCITINTATGVLATTTNSAPTPTAAADDFAAYPADCRQGTNNRYHISVWGYQVSNAIQANTLDGKHVFGITVRWDSVKGNGREEVKTFYSTYDSSSTATTSLLGAAPPGPVSNIFATPPAVSILPGLGKIISWSTSASAVSCTAVNFPGPATFNPAAILIKTFSTGPLFATKTYSITCMNASGVAGSTKSVTVIVVPGPTTTLNVSLGFYPKGASCAGAPQANPGSTGAPVTVTINNGLGFTQSGITSGTNTSQTRTFTGMPSGTYTVTVGALPSGYVLCSNQGTGFVPPGGVGSKSLYFN